MKLSADAAANRLVVEVDGKREDLDLRKVELLVKQRLAKARGFVL